MMSKLRAEDYNLIAARIVSLFPSENIGTYFMRAVPTAKSISGKYIPAKGKLVDKVRNLLYISGEKHRRPKSTQRIPENELENEPKNLSLMIDAAHDDDCLWLKNNNEPWDEVVLRWKKTRKYRIGQEHIFPTIHDFLENWPILKDAKGHVLINLDFEEMYEEQSLNFFKNWHFFFEKLLKLKQDQIKNETGLSLLETLFALKDDDKKIPVQITLLGYLIPPKGRISRKIKFSSTEVIESLIVRTDDAGNIDTIIKKKKEKSASRVLQSVQPYILVLGKLHDFSALYIVIDDVKYSFESAAKAFDVLFKIYHVLHAKYPDAANYLYLVIQKRYMTLILNMTQFRHT
ncbi:uncharacterized protein isoform X1 [Choristoneura fumiferana]|uniref:uncharacterized protein isoform X1 n=2 Tax=Choristoneura fumiferana TaxID=7141 RepID=UPI003D15C700